MPLFLVEATIVKTPYMGEGKRFEEQRLVEADDEAEAQELYEKYWTIQTEEYSVYYRIEGFAITGVISKGFVAEMLKKKEDRNRPLTRR